MTAAAIVFSSSVVNYNVQRASRPNLLLSTTPEYPHLTRTAKVRSYIRSSLFISNPVFPRKRGDVLVRRMLINVPLRGRENTIELGNDISPRNLAARYA